MNDVAKAEPPKKPELSPLQLKAQELIGRLLAEHGNQESVGVLLNVKQSYVSALDRGVRGAGPELRLRLAELFPADYEALTGKPPPPSSPLKPSGPHAQNNQTDEYRSRAAAAQSNAIVAYSLRHPDTSLDDVRALAELARHATSDSGPWDLGSWLANMERAVGIRAQLEASSADPDDPFKRVR